MPEWRRPFRPVEHYAAGGAAMVDAIERLERELAAVRAAVRADLSAILYLIPDLSPELVQGLRNTPPGRWAAVVMGAGDRLGSDDG